MEVCIKHNLPSIVTGFLTWLFHFYMCLKFHIGKFLNVLFYGKENIHTIETKEHAEVDKPCKKN